MSIKKVYQDVRAEFTTRSLTVGRLRREAKAALEAGDAETARCLTDQADRIQATLPKSTRCWSKEGEFRFSNYHHARYSRVLVEDDPRFVGRIVLKELRTP
jgi:hypothetical protein